VHSHVILSLGMPRSGTTLMQKMFERGDGYFHQKVAEGDSHHPLNGTALVDLVNVFRRKNVVVVRTVRKLDDLIASDHAGAAQGHKRPRTAEQIAEMVNIEERNWRAFLESDIDPTISMSRFEILYDALGDARLRERHLATVALEVPHPQDNLDRWLTFIGDVWDVKPVNVGRLSARVRGIGVPS